MTTILLIIGLLSVAPHIELPVLAGPPPVDLDRLARGVAVAETSDCTAGVGLSKLNCFGIRRRSGEFVTYASKEESYEAFKEMWPRVYGMRLPTRADAVKYTGNDSPDRWMATVFTVYSRPR